MDTAEIVLERWDQSGLALLTGMNTPSQKRFLGGPESEETLLDRHTRYLTYNLPGEVRMFRIVIDGRNVGSIGYWEHRRHDMLAYETGWELLEDQHGRGIGTAAAIKLVALLKREARHPELYAFPTPDNAGSNGICRRLGFTLLGPEDFEYPKGVISPHNVWRLELASWLPPAA